MRLSKLVLLAVATPALALAQPTTQPAPGTTPPGSPESARPDAPPTGTAPGAQAQPPEPSPEERAAAEREILGQFEGKKNFEMNGTALLVDASQGTIVLQRKDLPIAFLIVPQSAPIDVNGKKATLAEIQPGADVRATFNLAQQYPLALKLSAKDGTDKQQGTSTQERGGTKAPAKKQ